MDYYGSRLKAAKFEVKTKAAYRAQNEITWNYVGQSASIAKVLIKKLKVTNADMPSLFDWIMYFKANHS